MNGIVNNQPQFQIVYDVIVKNANKTIKTIKIVLEHAAIDTRNMGEVNEILTICFDYAAYYFLAQLVILETSHYDSEHTYSCIAVFLGFEINDNEYGINVRIGRRNEMLEKCCRTKIILWKPANIYF